MIVISPRRIITETIIIKKTETIDKMKMDTEMGTMDVLRIVNKITGILEEIKTTVIKEDVRIFGNELRYLRI